MSTELEKAVFFDRDGVLDVDKGYIYRPEELEWVEGAREAVALLRSLGYAIYVVTNQSGIARGFYTKEPRPVGKSTASTTVPIIPPKG